jgi:perosamine synthetase
MDSPWIPVAAPSFGGNEKAYVMDCLESTWISSTGKYIEQFEAAFARFCGTKHAISCCNGTVALHLALMALGVGPGDEVIVPTLTFVSTANAVTYCGARPVFVDSEPRTWNLDPESVEEKITPRTKGIIVVHLFGHPADMNPIVAIAQRRGLFVVEDAAQSHGAEYEGRKVGSIGDVAAFSFYGNKIITTGEGGMVVTHDDALAGKARQFKGYGMEPGRHYWYPVIGYNYRMTNLAAAIGVAQLERVEWHLERRREVASWYRDCLQGIDSVAWQITTEWAKHVWWMFTVLLNDAWSARRDDIMARLLERGIETRPVGYPIHTLPPYLDPSMKGCFPVAERIAAGGINLPTWAGLTRDDVRYVCDNLLERLA